jgi:hypothetical protein
VRRAVVVRDTYLENLGVEWKIILKCILEKKGRKVWTGCLWLRIRTIGGLL